ncbi:FAD-dependent monooxygenase [Actinoplanes sp. N902-109]|uniref:FAD-dependent monooxygenase n=1 Tax=Actinoplanes sp. (strain N902-109) TaxID=649831 RepID=UPI00032939A8|nr:FAD-dependent monooxygenase [Actinoplanes sp. N902-109]AGL17959.1 FAD-binding monooxygenase [Actinoplanes sp. N902-109]
MEDVVIAGGGPNGLMLACELALAGVRPVVLERLSAPTPEYRANGLVGQVVRVLDRRGLYQRLVHSGEAPVPAGRFLFGAFPLELADVAENPLYTVLIPQREIQRVLRERAVELGVRIRAGHEVAGLRQRDDSVVVEVRDRPAIEAAYLVGADGGRSVVRKLAGIGFPGVTQDRSVSRSAHVSVPESMIDAAGRLVVPGFGTVPPMQHTRTERGVVVWGIMGGQTMLTTMEFDQPAEGEATLAELAASVRRVLGAEVPVGPPVGDGPHLMRRLAGGNTRLAERYRDGRVLLLGDAAHVHSAIGGPGLNLGLQDAVNLGWKLAAAVRDPGRTSLLDSYEKERRPAAERVTMHTQAQTALITPGSEVTALRVLFGELMTMPAVRAHLAAMLAGSDIRYPMGPATGPLVGSLAPDFPGLTDVTRTGRALLIDPAGTLSAGRWADRVDTAVLEHAPEPMLLRPDGYVAWQATGTGTLEDALTWWFGA